MMMHIFLVISAILISGWAFEFVSSSWRLTFENWAFFAIMSTVAVILTMVVTLLGVICLRSFGLVLSNHLNAKHIVGHGIFEPATPFEPEKHPEMSRLAWSMEEGVSFAEKTMASAYPGNLRVARPVPWSSKSQVTVTPPIRAATKGGLQRSKSTLHGRLDSDPFRDSISMSVEDDAEFHEDWDAQISRSRWSKETTRKSGVFNIKRWVIE